MAHAYGSHIMHDVRRLWQQQRIRSRVKTLCKVPHRIQKHFGQRVNVGALDTFLLTGFNVRLSQHRLHKFEVRILAIKLHVIPVVDSYD